MKMMIVFTWWFATVPGAPCNRIWPDNQSTLNGVRKISHSTDGGGCSSYIKQTTYRLLILCKLDLKIPDKTGCMECKMHEKL